MHRSSSNGQGDSSADVPVVFGDVAVDGALATWLRQTHRQLTAVTPLDSGGSGGAPVSGYVRELDPDKQGGRVILKLLAPSPEAAGEPGQHKAALLAKTARNAEFIRRHLVEQAYEPQLLGNSWVMFQRPAGDEETVTLAGLGLSPRLPNIARSIVGAVLSGWNPDDPRDADMPAADFVVRLLGARLDSDAALRVWARDRLGPRAETLPWISLPDHPRALPNPLALNTDCPLGRYDAGFLMHGRAHGDLHPGNIMVPPQDDAEPDDFTLIDLSRFRPDAPLARDPAHLSLCLVAEFLPHLTEEARGQLVTGLLSRSGCDGPLIPQGLAGTVVAVREAVFAWGASRKIQTGWRRQWYLALLACALMFTARERYSDRDRWWFYCLAAHAGWAYLEEMKAERPSDAPLLRLRSAQDAGGASAAPERDGTVPSPPPPAAAPADDDPLQTLLTEMWETFASPLEQLTTARILEVRSHLPEYVRMRAITFRTLLGHLTTTSARLPAGQALRSLDRVHTALRTVADDAATVCDFLAPAKRIQLMGPFQQTPGDRALQNLVNALDDLLAAIRDAKLARTVPFP